MQLGIGIGNGDLLVVQMLVTVGDGVFARFAVLSANPQVVN